MENIFKIKRIVICIGINGLFAFTSSAQIIASNNFKLTNASVNSKGEMVITPSKLSSQHDFDFLVGNWNLHNKKLKARLSNSNEWIEFESTVENQTILNGIGNTDIYKTTSDGKPYEGVAVRLFNPKTKLWSIYWADSNEGKMDPAMIGSFDGNIGTFYCKDVYNGKPVLVVFHWDKTDKNKPVWSQAFSTDNGLTWEWNFTNVSTRPK